MAYAKGVVREITPNKKTTCGRNHAHRFREPWSVDNGPCTMFLGPWSLTMFQEPWSLDNGPLAIALGHGPRNMVRGQWIRHHGHWNMAQTRGPWTMARGSWFMDHGAWTMIIGPWSLDHGPRTMVHGPWSVDHGRGPSPDCGHTVRVCPTAIHGRHMDASAHIKWPDIRKNIGGCAAPDA